MMRERILPPLAAAGKILAWSGLFVVSVLFFLISWIWTAADGICRRIRGRGERRR